MMSYMRADGLYIHKTNRRRGIMFPRRLQTLICIACFATLVPIMNNSNANINVHVVSAIDGCLS